MLKHLILVVHGVGEQIAGHTVDETVAGTIAEFERQGGAAPDIEANNMVISEAKFPTSESQGTSEEAIPFPIHKRLLKGRGNTGQPANTLFAEVFWADRSKAPKGIFATFFDLLWVVLGVGYLALENAESTSSKTTRWTVAAFVWIFHTLIAPAWAVLIIAAVVLLPEFLLQELAGSWNLDFDWFFKSIWTMAVIGGLAIVMAIWLAQTRMQTKLTRCIWQGLAMIGGWILVQALILSFYRDAYLFPEFLNMNFGTPADYVIWFVVSLISVSWWMCLLICMALYVLWIIELAAFPRDERHPGQRRVFAPICSGLMFLWFTFQLTLLQALYSGSKSIAGEDVFSGIFTTGSVFIANLGLFHALFSVSMSLYGCILLSVLGLLICLAFLRWVFRKNLDERPDILKRLILNPTIQIVFAATTLGAAFMASRWISILAAQVYDSKLAALIKEATSIKFLDVPIDSFVDFFQRTRGHIPGVVLGRWAGRILWREWLKQYSWRRP